jgi:hypothetical protein
MLTTSCRRAPSMVAKTALLVQTTNLTKQYGPCAVVDDVA